MSDLDKELAEIEAAGRAAAREGSPAAAAFASEVARIRVELQTEQASKRAASAAAWRQDAVFREMFPDAPTLEQLRQASRQAALRQDAFPLASTPAEQLRQAALRQESNRSEEKPDRFWVLVTLYLVITIITFGHAWNQKYEYSGVENRMAASTMSAAFWPFYLSTQVWKGSAQ